jgi:hypothetical protein
MVPMSHMTRTSFWWLDWANGWTLDGVQVRADFYWGWKVEIYVDCLEYVAGGKSIDDGKWIWVKRWLVHPDSMLPFMGPKGGWYGDPEDDRKRFAEHCRLSEIHSMALMEKLKNTTLDFENWPEQITLRKLMEDLTTGKQRERIHA